ncbi:MAG: DUF192 domain-containing protein [Elusimicrobia bacterium]|nr:DUF192 domain-containing protein [Elusimicrobiota bacterium]
MSALLKAVLLSAALAASHVAGPQQGLPKLPLTFPNGKTIQVDLAATPAAREIGLMHRRALPRDYGMLFAFPGEQELQFWMKNTLVDLDMVFLDKEGAITALHPRVPRSRVDAPEETLARRSGRGQYVLELPAGAAGRHKLRVGQRLRFALPRPLS